EIFLELGPQAVLSALVQEGLSEGAQGRARLWATLRKEQDEVSSTLTALGGLYTHGQPVEWSAFFGPLGGHKVPLPTYAFERQRYWLDAGGGAKGDVSLAGGFLGGASAVGREHRGGGRRQLCFYRSSVAGHTCLAWRARGVWSCAVAG